MKNFKRIIGFLMIALVMVSMVACNDGGENNNPPKTPDVTSVEWVDVYTSLEPGNYTLNAKALPEGSVQDMKYTLVVSKDGVSLNNNVLTITDLSVDGEVFKVKATSIYDPSISSTMEITINNKNSVTVEIRTEEDLRLMLADDEALTKKYELKNDIVLTQDWPGVGVADSEQDDGSVVTGKGFNGLFDGKGYKISGINVEGSFNAGFFNQIDSLGIVKNVCFEGQVSARGWSGAIAGINYGTVQNCSTYINVTLLGGSAGSLVCVNKGILSNCVAFGALVTGTALTEAKSGGLVAANEGTIENCFGSVDDMGTDTYIAWNLMKNTTYMLNSEQMMTASNFSSFDTDIWYVADEYYPLLKNANFVVPSKPLSLVINNEETTINLEDTLTLQIDVTVVNKLESTVVKYELAQEVLGVNLSDTGLLTFTKETPHLSVVSVLVSIDGTNIEKNFTVTVTNNPVPEADVVNISNAEGLFALATTTSDEALAKKYVLTNDIKVTTWWTTQIGSEEHPFTGTFDGCGHKIIGIAGGDAKAGFGFFGVIGKTGVVENFTLEGTKNAWEAPREWDFYVGAGSAGLCAVNNGTIKNIVIQNLKVMGTGQWVSGVVFENKGTISNVISSAVVVKNEDASAYGCGFVCNNEVGTITNCYVDVTISNAISFIHGDENVANLKTTTELSSASLYTGWDTEVWNIVDGSVPTLKVTK